MFKEIMGRHFPYIVLPFTYFINYTETVYSKMSHVPYIPWEYF